METINLYPAVPEHAPLPFELTESDKQLARIAASCIELERQERNLRDLGLMPDAG